MRVYFIRHGQTDANLRYNAFPWNTNCPMNETGQHQARRAGEYLRKYGVRPARIITSPLVRTVQTSELLAEYITVPVVKDDRLLEVNAGDWCARTIKDVYETVMALPIDQRYIFGPPHGESWADAGQRLITVVQDAEKQGLSEIIIVSHEAPIQSAICELLHVPYESWAQYEIVNTSISLLVGSSPAKWRSEYIGKNVDPSNVVTQF